MPRHALAVTLLVAAGLVPLLMVAAGWDWYVDGPQLVLGLLAGYAAGAWLPRAWAAVGVVLAASTLTVANQVAGMEYHWLDDLVFFLVVVGGPAAAGAAVTVRARQVRRLEQVSAEYDEQQRVDIAAARLEEQNRIQQQVHARLAERIAGIAVRAGGAQVAGAGDAFAVIEAEAREVLDHLRAALGSLAHDRSEEPELQVDEWQRPPIGTLDVLVPAVLGVSLAIETLLIDRAIGPPWANVLAALAVVAPLVLRRSHPILATVLCFVAGLGMSAWLTPLTLTVTGVAFLVLIFYSVGAWCRGWSWVLGWLLAAAGSVAVELVSGPGDSADSDGPWIMLLWTVGAVVLGRITAGWQQRLRRTEELLAALDRGKGSAVRLAMARERQALAGELHDTVAHAMTVVCLQAGAQQRAAGDPDAVLHTISTTALQSLAELRDGLDAIESSEHPLEPGRITAVGRRMGVDVAVSVPTPSPTGPAAVLAFRVIREAVVNVARHAPGASVEVRIERYGDSLDVRVLDDGGTTPALRLGTGTGLSGLADAIAQAGGRLEWGHREGGGFRVAAALPASALAVAQ